MNTPVCVPFSKLPKVGQQLGGGYIVLEPPDDVRAPWFRSSLNLAHALALCAVPRRYGREYAQSGAQICIAARAGPPGARYTGRSPPVLHAAGAPERVRDVVHISITLLHTKLAHADKVV